MIKLTFSDGSQVACEELTDSFSMVQTYYQNLSPVTDSVKAELVFSVALANKIKSFGDDDITAEVWIGEEKVFTGFLRKTFNFIKTQRNQPIPVEIVSPAIKLDAGLDEKVVLINKTVNEIILYLGQKLDMTLNCPINKIITCFVAESGDNIGNIIKELLFENGYTYSFNSNGVFTVIPLFNAPSEVTQVFNGDNCLNEIKIQKKEVATKGVSLKWASVEYIADTLIFDETEGRTEQKLCSVKIPPAGYMYGSDRESNNEDGIHYLEYDSTLGKVLHVTSARREEKGNLLGVVSKRFENLGTRALWRAYNNSYITSSEYTKFRIYGNAYIQTSVNVTKSTEGTEKLKEYNIQYLSDSDSVEALSLKLVDYYKYATFTLTIQSKSDYEPGTFVYITDYGIGSYTGRILQKTTNGRGFKVYIVESVLPYTPASVAATQRTRTSGAGAIGERGQTGASAYNYIGIINDSSEVPESDNGDFFLCGANFFMDRGLLTTDKGLLKLSGKFLRLKSRFEKGFIYYADANGKWNKVEDKNNFRYSVAINDLFFVTGQASPIFEENTVGKVYKETGLDKLPTPLLIDEETSMIKASLIDADDIFTKQLTLKNGGLIKSVNYNETDRTGFLLDGDTGKADLTDVRLRGGLTIDKGLKIINNVTTLNKSDASGNVTFSGNKNAYMFFAEIITDLINYEKYASEGFAGWHMCYGYIKVYSKNGTSTDLQLSFMPYAYNITFWRTPSSQLIECSMLSNDGTLLKIKTDRRGSVLSWKTSFELIDIQTGTTTKSGTWDDSDVEISGDLYF